MKYQRLVLALLATVLLSACAMLEDVEATDSYWPAQDRTSNRTVLGDIIYPKWIFNLPEHAEFTPLMSNTDPQHQHPAQWAGQDWDTTMWPKNLTPELALRRLWAIRVFTAQYAEDQKPVLEVGPTFWKLSDLDRRRAVKLVADYTHVFERGHKMIVLRDWSSKDNVGTYTDKGMQLK